MSPEDRRLRADAERNRRRLLNAAEELFCERGLDVGVAEIAQRAGIGRGTLFRNFPTKEDLIAAIVAERMHEAAERARELLDAPDPDDALFGLLAEMAGRQQLDRALFEAVAETFLANEEIRAAHGEIIAAIDTLLTRAQESGAVREDVGAMDVLMMFKGVCEAASAFAHLGTGVVERQLDLVRAALAPPAGAQQLRGRPLKLEEIHGASPGSSAASAA